MTSRWRHRSVLRRMRDLRMKMWQRRLVESWQLQLAQWHREKNQLHGRDCWAEGVAACIPGCSFRGNFHRRFWCMTTAYQYWRLEWRPATTARGTSQPFFAALDLLIVAAGGRSLRPLPPRGPIRRFVKAG